MKTAEELLANNIDAIKDLINDDDLYYFYRGVICEFAKEFAEMHVTEALRVKIKAMEERYDTGYSLDELDAFTKNAYPLTNIK